MRKINIWVQKEDLTYIEESCESDEPVSKFWHVTLETEDKKTIATWMVFNGLMNGGLQERSPWDVYLLGTYKEVPTNAELERLIVSGEITWYKGFEFPIDQVKLFLDEKISFEQLTTDFRKTNEIEGD